MANNMQIDGKNFLKIDGVPVCKFYPERGTLQFVDRDRRRCNKRGTRFIEVKVTDLIRMCSGQDATVSTKKSTK